MFRSSSFPDRRFQILAAVLIVLVLGLSARAIVSLWNLTGTESTGRETPPPDDAEPVLAEEDLWSLLEDPAAPAPERLQAAAAISRLGATAAQRLRKNLDSPDVSVRRYAAMALRDLKPADRRALPRLIELVSDPDEQMAIAAMRTAATIGPREETVRRTLKASLSSAKEEIRRSAATVLADLKPSLVQFYFDNLQHSDPQVVAIMGRAIRDAASSNPDEVAEGLTPRILADDGLGPYSPLWSLVAGIRPAVHQRLHELAKSHPKPLVRARIAQILIARLPGSAAAGAVPAVTPDYELAVTFLPTFKEAIDAAPDDHVRGLIFSLHYQVRKPAISVLEEYVSSPRRLVRIHAAIALADLNPDESLIPALMEGLADREPYLREYCADQIGKLTPLPAEAVELLEKLRKDPVRGVAFSAATALQNNAKYGRQKVTLP